jgi:hypothetical protein
MKIMVRHTKRRDFTDTERVALRNVGAGMPIDPALYKRLEKLGLVELKDNVWATSQQGHVELMFQRAR